MDIALEKASSPATPMFNAPKRLIVIILQKAGGRLRQASRCLVRGPLLGPPFFYWLVTAATSASGISINPTTSCGEDPLVSISETTPELATAVCTAEPSAACAATASV